MLSSVRGLLSRGWYGRAETQPANRSQMLEKQMTIDF